MVYNFVCLRFSFDDVCAVASTPRSYSNGGFIKWCHYGDVMDWVLFLKPIELALVLLSLGLQY